MKQERKAINVEDLKKVIEYIMENYDDFLSLAGYISTMETSETVVAQPKFEVTQNSEEPLKNVVTDYLLRMKMPRAIKGYRYIRAAIIMVLEDIEMLEMMTKGLYPELAKKFNTTSTRVERAIRHAIAATWEKGNLDEIEKIFGYSIDSCRKQPTNSEFIASLVDTIKINR